MAYDDMHCPCGGTKFTETMLCQACEAAFSDTPESKSYRDSNVSLCFRRTAAIRLLALSRRRGGEKRRGVAKV